MKFRVWDIKNNCYFDEICYIDNNGILYKDEHYNSPSNLDQEEYKIEYFIGLLDKNGKEIFVGDIIKKNERINPSELDAKNFAPGGTISLVKVKFFEIKNIFSFEHRIFDTPMEIVGNINENPKLLEK